ncbi:polysaccharide synthesis protein GtrA [Burkholderia ubonensis]|uniref:GtrA family protein n=1 Tax=Burkholderia ubonensis TaxID=101571 RepID=UPI0007533C0C|nr:GtrA family protein [Burkholderia ubonensis]KVO82736.1 polysaccharide synthesis protein GtrA [Burkholderia ubonensis]KVZ65066.1 polysaccharide synthesis protein GtrA [Burkholderia ubonensis]KVZ71794.1 polysaccharide synthesis protein GtrA [Burkholderia ubonensis]KWC13734.1 polysaccharide synthesis protein GtrA [Burkholderia ubonensis]
MMVSTYFVASSLSLVADWLLFLVLTSVVQLDAGISAWAAYLIGGVVNYALSRRFVFRSDTSGRRQIGEALLFAASCGFGSLLTGGIVHVAAAMLGNIAAKWIAVVVSFISLYWVRRVVVFRMPGARVPAAVRAAGHREVGGEARVEATVR